MTVITSSRTKRVYRRVFQWAKKNKLEPVRLNKTQMELNNGGILDISNLLLLVGSHPKYLENEIVTDYLSHYSAAMKAADLCLDGGGEFDPETIIRSAVRVVVPVTGSELEGTLIGRGERYTIQWLYGLKVDHLLLTHPDDSLADVVGHGPLARAVEANYVAMSRDHQELDITHEMGGVFVHGHKSLPGMVFHLDACAEGLGLERDPNGYLVAMPTRSTLIAVPARRVDMLIALLEFAMAVYCKAKYTGDNEQPLSPVVFHASADSTLTEVFDGDSFLPNDAMRELHGPESEWKPVEGYWEGAYLN